MLLTQVNSNTQENHGDDLQKSTKDQGESSDRRARLLPLSDHRLVRVVPAWECTTHLENKDKSNFTFEHRQSYAMQNQIFHRRYALDTWSCPLVSRQSPRVDRRVQWLRSQTPGHYAALPTLEHNMSIPRCLTGTFRFGISPKRRDRCSLGNEVLSECRRNRK